MAFRECGGPFKNIPLGNLYIILEEASPVWYIIRSAYILMALSQGSLGKTSVAYEQMRMTFDHNVFYSHVLYILGTLQLFLVIFANGKWSDLI